ncbi:MAG: hypothetical protein WDW36_007933 [Sanguina aurantia]
MQLIKGYGSHPPPQLGEQQPWTESVMSSPVALRNTIFCNRALNMRKIKAVGFDMDYTLAQYKPESFEGLAYKETVKKMVEVFQYPAELLQYKFEWDYMVKGLIMDKERGNMLKVDRHKYVKIAYHGFSPLSAEERKGTYEHRNGGQSFDESGFGMVDTLFSLAESYLFMQLVELKDKKTSEHVSAKSYKDLYRDLRTAVDMCHRDGSLKRAVAASPQDFIHTDPNLAGLLTSLRSSGRSVFLATNSLWDYTHVVMNYLLFQRTGSAKTTEWLTYFDSVVVGCNKPAFFTTRAPLFSIDPITGLLKNTDNGAPIIPIDEQDLTSTGSARLPPQHSSRSSSSHDNGNGNYNGSSSGGSSSGSSGSGSSGEQGALDSCDGVSIRWSGSNVKQAPVYQGGSYMDVHKKLGVASGDEVLYVGDHIYGDIVKSKKDIGWRTMLVVPELALELELAGKTQMVLQELTMLREQRDSYADKIHRLQWSIQGGNGTVVADESAHRNSLSLLRNLMTQRDALKARHTALLHQHHTRFHRVWGQLMKTGHQNSRYAHQIERFACLYTSHVSNMTFVSPNKSFMGRLDWMAHEEHTWLEQQEQQEQGDA